MKGALASIRQEHFEAFWRRRDMPLSKVAKALGVTTQAVSLRAKKMGLPPRGKEVCKYSSDEEFRRMWVQGVPSAEIAKRLGYGNAGAVSHRRKSMGLPSRRCRKEYADWLASEEERLSEAMRNAA